MAWPTFLRQSCEVVLPDGSLASEVLVLPKWTLRFAEERPDLMAAALRLAMAASIEDVMAACEDPDTHQYDIARHMVLRRSYVSVFVTWPDGQDGEPAAVDFHKHYIEGGGYTEHGEFVKGLIKEGSLASLKLDKKKTQKYPQTKPKPKRSAALKAMLQAPGGPPTQPATEPASPLPPADSAKTARGPPPAVPAPPGDEGAERAPPRRAPVPSAAAGSSSGDVPPKNCTEADRRCKAKTHWNSASRSSPGGQCSRPALPGGMFCAQHQKAFESQHHQQRTARAMAAAEHAKVRLANQRSREEAGENAAIRAERQRRVDARLAAFGLRRVETDPCGNCQFIAVAKTAGTTQSHLGLREEAADYLTVFDCTRRPFGETARAAFSAD